MLQRIASCQQCKGTYTAYVMYTFSAAQHAIENGDLWLAYGMSTQEVSGICEDSTCFSLVDTCV